MTAKRGLGRGLDAILQKPDETTLTRQLPVDLLVPNRYQPRADFAEAGLEELAASIAVQGVIQPIIVSPQRDGRYVIVAGERRWRAARMADLAVVPVVVREVNDDRELVELALVENVQRADLNGMEEAEAYRVLRESFGLSQEEIGKRVGRARSTITNSLRLLRLPLPVQDLLRQGLIDGDSEYHLQVQPGPGGSVSFFIHRKDDPMNALDFLVDGDNLCPQPPDPQRRALLVSPIGRFGHREVGQGRRGPQETVREGQADRAAGVRVVHGETRAAEEAQARPRDLETPREDARHQRYRGTVRHDARVPARQWCRRP